MRVIGACLLLGTLVLSGCLGEAATEEQSQARSIARRQNVAAAPAPGPSLDVSPVELEGRTTTYGCVVTPVATNCQAFMGGKALQPFADGEDNALRLTGNLTWIADTPATASLNAYLVVDNRYQYGFPVAYGPSPVVVDFDLTPYAGHFLAIGISSTSCTCSMVGGVVLAGPQDFVFRGEFTSEPSP